MRLAEAERVEILVLVDNITDSLSSTPAFVQREWPRIQQVGMRFHSGGAIGAAMLSHGHRDHGGGLPRALAMIRAANGGRDVRLYLHPGLPRPLGARQADGFVLPYEDIPTPERWRELGAEPIVTDQPLTCLDDLCFVSGEIPRVTPYEKGIPNQVRRLPDGSWVPDTPVTDERFMAVHVRGKGLVVFSACSHAGIVNVLLHARASFPGVKLHAATGEEVVLPCAVGKVFTL